MIGKVSLNPVSKQISRHAKLTDGQRTDLRKTQCLRCPLMAEA